jgi:2-oxoglutarate ferredoxin oxidoreductase subunit delta
MATGRVEIVKERCKSCGYCIKFCPKGVLAVGKEVNSKGYEVVYPEIRKTASVSFRRFSVRSTSP